MTDWIQWPARRVTWGVGAGAIALVVLQVCPAALNIRGVRKNESS